MTTAGGDAATEVEEAAHRPWLLAELLWTEGGDDNHLYASDIISLYQGVASLVQYTGKTKRKVGELMGKKMGIGKDQWWYHKDPNDKKQSKHWKLRLSSSGDVLCAGSSALLQDLHSALVKGDYMRDTFYEWTQKNWAIPEEVYRKLLKIAPWVKQEPKSKVEPSSKVDAPKNKGKSKVATAPKAGGSKDAAETPPETHPTTSKRLFASPSDDSFDTVDDAEECVHVALGVLAAGGDAASNDAADRIKRAVSYIRAHQLSDASSPDVGSDAGFAQLVQGDNLILELPSYPQTKLLLKATPRRGGFHVAIDNTDVIQHPSLKVSDTNKIVGMMPGWNSTARIPVPGKRTLRDLAPLQWEQDEATANKRPAPLPAPRGAYSYSNGFMQYSLPLVPIEFVNAPVQADIWR